MAQIKTWPIECDELQLEMVAFCVESMRQMLEEDIRGNAGCNFRGHRRSKPQIRRDVKAAEDILAQAYKGQVALELKRSFKVSADGKAIVAKKRRAKR